LLLTLLLVSSRERYLVNPHESTIPIYQIT
jgi:hypothetical protein